VAILVAISAAAAILLHENLAMMILAFQMANYAFVLLALFAYLSGLIFWSLRWHVTLSTVGHNIPIRSIYLIIFGGIFINNITPFTYAGGDPVARAYILKKTQRVPYHSGFATILTEFIIDLPIYFSLLMLGFLLSIQGAALSYIVLAFVTWLATLLLWSLFFFKVISNATGSESVARAMGRVMKFLRRRTNKLKLKKSVERFYSRADLIITNRRVVFYVILLTVTLWVLAIARLYLIFTAFKWTPPLQMLLFAVTLPAIVGMIPFLPGGLGTVDATIASVFLLFGAPLGIAISVTLVERLITLVFSTLVGAGAISYLGIKYRRVISSAAKRRKR
jgi:uncharacterized protein (TIRG00374 family)